MAKKKKIKENDDISDAEIINEAIKDANDIFEMAAMETISIEQNVNITNYNVNKPSLPIQRKTWKELKLGMDNEHAERFNRILTELPDREFVRVYLKALEFVKPKIIREPGSRGKETDTTINIQINRR